MAAPRPFSVTSTSSLPSPSSPHFPPSSPSSAPLKEEKSDHSLEGRGQKRPRAAPPAPLRRVLPRRQTALGRSFADTYGVASFWENTGEKVTDVVFETKAVELPVVRDVAEWAAREEALTQLRSRLVARVPALGDPQGDVDGMPLILAEDEVRQWSSLVSLSGCLEESSAEEDQSASANLRRHVPLEDKERLLNRIKPEPVDPPSYSPAPIPPRTRDWAEWALPPPYIPEGLVDGQPEIFIADPAAPHGLLRLIPLSQGFPAPSASSYQKDPTRVRVRRIPLPIPSPLHLPPECPGPMRPLPPYVPLYFRHEWQVTRLEAGRPNTLRFTRHPLGSLH